ncbi:MAG TPA: hypothetical protein VFO38_05575 [Candidatus Saccharimonadales bacterium]|nr:hypothetical protein [Candidatus Saccharimonadales bacterium]
MARKKVSKKTILITVGIIVALALTVGAGMLVWWLQHKDTVQQIPGSEAPPTNVSEAQKLSFTGDIDGSNKKLNEALANPNTPEQEKYDLYVQLGVNWSNQKQYQKALTEFEKAEAIKQGFTVSHLMGEQYEALGNKQKAIEYYKKAISQLDPTTIGYNSNKRVYEAKVKELGGSL